MCMDDQPQLDLAGLMAYLAGQRDILAAYLCGSVARGQANRLSEVDVAVRFAADLDRETIAERQVALMARLDRYADREVQVTALNHAAPSFAYEVIRDGRLLCEHDPPARIAFEVGTLKQYFDLQPMLAAYDRAPAKRIQEVGLGTGKRRHPSALGAAEHLRERLAGVAGR